MRIDCKKMMLATEPFPLPHSIRTTLRLMFIRFVRGGLFYNYSVDWGRPYKRQSLRGGAMRRRFGSDRGGSYTAFIVLIAVMLTILAVVLGPTLAHLAQHK